MPKIKRLVTFYGQTLNPIYRFMKSATLKVSPFDEKGNKLAKALYTHLKGGDPRLKMPEFKLAVDSVPEYKNTWLEVVYRLLIRK